MKLVTYRVDGEIHHGVLREERDGSTVSDVGRGDLLGLLEAGADGLAGARRAGGRSRPLSDVRLLSPLARPPKLLALAANYQDHIVEAGKPPVDKSTVLPKLFLKVSSSIIGPDEPVHLPSVSKQTDWEAELAAVIGTRCRNVPVERALDFVAGYTIANDVSARSMEWGENRPESPWNGFWDWMHGKWPDGFAPLGPCLLTADEVPDPQDLEFGLTVNGKSWQRSNTEHMIFSVAETIAWASRFMTLEPGDVIEMGTPGGVGAASGTYLKPGDVMEAWVDRIGTLRTPVEGPLA